MDASAALCPFARLVGGEWHIGPLRHVFEWGIGQRTVLARTYDQANVAHLLLANRPRRRRRRRRGPHPNRGGVHRRTRQWPFVHLRRGRGRSRRHRPRRRLAAGEPSSAGQSRGGAAPRVNAGWQISRQQRSESLWPDHKVSSYIFGDELTGGGAGAPPGDHAQGDGARDLVQFLRVVEEHRGLRRRLGVFLREPLVWGKARATRLSRM